MALLKKSSLDIPLLSECEEDKKFAALLSMKLKPAMSITENMEEIRKNIISQSSLPTSNFSRSREEKAVRLLNERKKGLGIAKKIKLAEEVKEVEKQSTVLSLVGDYGSSSESE